VSRYLLLGAAFALVSGCGCSEYTCVAECTKDGAVASYDAEPFKVCHPDSPEAIMVMVCESRNYGSCVARCKEANP